MSQPTAPNEGLMYPRSGLTDPKLSTDSPLRGSPINEQCINDNILANNKLNNNSNIMKDIRNYHETETNNHNKKLSIYKNYISVAEITDILLSSKTTTAPVAASVALTGIGLPCSIPTAFATATICCSLSKTLKTKI